MDSRPGAAPDLLAYGYPLETTWTELVIRPFDKRMAPDLEWLQWVDDECIRIPRLTYWLLGLAWPMLFRLYTRELIGQRT